MNTHNHQHQNQEPHRIQHPKPIPPDAVADHQRQKLTEFFRSDPHPNIRAEQGPTVETPDVFQIVVNDRVCETRVVSEPRCRLAHDLNNCLNIIMGSSELLSKKLTDDEDAKRYLHRIATAVSRMADLIENSHCRIVMLPPADRGTPELGPTDPRRDR